MGSPIRRRRRKDERGQGILEYGLIAGAVALVVIAVLQLVGGNSKNALCATTNGVTPLTCVTGTTQVAASGATFTGFGAGQMSLRSMTVDTNSKIWFAEYPSQKVGVLDPVSGQQTTISLPNDGPAGLIAGPSATVYVTLQQPDPNRIIQLNESGNIIGGPWTIPNTGATPAGAGDGVMGSDGNIWFTEFSVAKIGMLNISTGVVTNYSVQTNGTNVVQLSNGPDGNVWFTDNCANKVGNITPSGVITEWSIPAGFAAAAAPDCNGQVHYTGSTSYPVGIVLGPDKSLYVVVRTSNQIMRVVPNGGLAPTMTSLATIPTPFPSSNATRITVGPDANLWFTEWTASKVGRVSLGDQSVTEWQAPTGFDCLESIVTAGRNVYYADPCADTIGHMQTPLGT